jgi:hypothetical protein
MRGPGKQEGTDDDAACAKSELPAAVHSHEVNFS